MRIVRFDPAPAFLAFGVLTPAGEGVGRLLPRGAGAATGNARPTGTQGPIAAEVRLDLPALCGEPPLRFRRMDRYGALGFAAAHRALAGAAAALERAPRLAPPAEAGPAGTRTAEMEADPAWGVMIGSSVACGGSIAQHQRDLRERPVASLSPAGFVRTVANAVNGDISIGWRLGGPSETFVTGRTAGAEALAAAGAALLDGRARWILAGAVEAPDPVPGRSASGGRAGSDEDGSRETMAEGAAIAVMGIDLRPRGTGALRLRACMRCHDPGRRFSLAAALDALGPNFVGTVIVANTIPAQMDDRIAEEAGARSVLRLPLLCGELGAAGTPVAAALADVLTSGSGGSAAERRGDRGLPGVLVIARDPEGGTAALALDR